MTSWDSKMALISKEPTALQDTRLGKWTHSLKQPIIV